jgi:hypothetical protein
VSPKVPSLCSIHRLEESIEHTNNKQSSRIPTLNNDVLLNIFYLYGLHIRDEGNEDDSFVCRQRWWYKLAQVSQRWRRLMLASPSWLDLRLLCTYGVPVADMLEHSPPLPITVYYMDSDRFRRMTAKDEKGILLALSHHNRVIRIILSMPALKLGKFITAMDEQFPILDHLSIASWTEEETSLILPTTFQAPNLRYINLHYAALPIRSPLLTTMGGLVNLWLEAIPQSTYFPPSCILTRLSLMPQLERLMIGFPSPIPNRDVVRQLLDTQIMTHVTLPNLRQFLFKGVSAYLEGLLSWISAPSLSVLDVHFFTQLTFTVPRLLQFIQGSENFRFGAVSIIFENDFVCLSGDTLQETPLHMRIACRHLDWQVASAVQIFDALSPVLTIVEKLTLSHTEHNRSSEWHNEVDRAQWCELLRPFSSVKILHVEKELVGGLSHSLRSRDGEMPLEVLPNLLELQYSGGIDLGDVLYPFITERQAAGHPVLVMPYVIHNHFPCLPSHLPSCLRLKGWSTYRLRLQCSCLRFKMWSTSRLRRLTSRL